MGLKDEIIPSFFCVPDISGFTRFIATADINFSKNFIPALLSKLISANILKMDVAEIEGDAIFFYRTGRLPSIKMVAKQCDLFYKNFYGYIERIRMTDPDNYTKYFSSGNIGLKIIIHYGKISKTKIKGHIKLIGEDVIVAHRLLKNNVVEDEYILLSENYLKKTIKHNLPAIFSAIEIKKGVEEYEHIGKIHYEYLPVDNTRYSQAS